MNVHFLKPTFLLFLLNCLVVFYSCHHRDKRQEVERALANYDRLIKKMDADSISLMYTANGELGDIARGRDSIRKFLSTFTNVEVLSVSSSSEKIDLEKDTIIQSGRYNQLALINHRDTVRPTGTYVARWIWQENEGWKIQRMTTTPDKNPSK